MKKKGSAARKKRKVIPEVTVDNHSSQGITLQEENSRRKKRKLNVVVTQDVPVVTEAPESKNKEMTSSSTSMIAPLEEMEKSNDCGSILARSGVFQSLPFVDPTLDDNKQFEAFLTRFIFLRKQIRTIESFIHLNEFQFFLNQIMSNTQVNCSSSNPQTSWSQTGVQKLSLQDDFTYLLLVVKFVQMKIVHMDKLLDLPFLTPVLHEFGNSPLTTHSFSQSTVTPQEIQQQKQFICNRYSSGSKTIKQYYREQFDQLYQILLNYRSLLETILDIKWECLQYMRQ
mmetsp:Transcript_15537/g.16835  ORF Transcript_15537/g.16835 Transcript_15537/m.16835 type:complete len:284 (+) Transcript_15537:25-876(+)